MEKLNKLEIHAALVNEVNLRAAKLQESLSDALEATANETKSTAGDKHETSRAMAQLEQEKIGGQIAEISKLKEVLFRINPTDTHSTIQLGSLIETSAGIFYISVGIGAFSIQGKNLFCITPMAPLCQKLLGKSVNDSIEWQGKQITITALS